MDPGILFIIKTVSETFSVDQQTALALKTLHGEYMIDLIKVIAQINICCEIVPTLHFCVSINTIMIKGVNKK